MYLRRNNLFSHHHDWIQKTILTFKPEEDSFSPRGHLDKQGKAHSLFLTIFLRSAKKDQSSWATTFDYGSTLVISKRMFEVYSGITEQDFARRTRVGRTFQVERQYLQQPNGWTIWLSKGVQLVVKYGYVKIGNRWEMGIDWKTKLWKTQGGARISC